MQTHPALTLEDIMLDMGARAHGAAKAVRTAPANVRTAALMSMAAHLRSATTAILAANADDLARGAAHG